MVHDKKKYFQTVYKSYEMHCVQLRNVDNTVIYMQWGGNNCLIPCRIWKFAHLQRNDHALIYIVV